jgi:hypothetical protein
MALVAGRKRVPNPATGKTALRILVLPVLWLMIQAFSISGEIQTNQILTTQA